MNTILTIATNFKQSAIDRFVLSFRQFNTIDKVIIVINHDDVKNNKDYIKKTKEKWNIDWRVFDDSYLFNKYFIISERFSIFESILKNEDVDLVFLCDCRDVLFQGDPFISTNSLTFFQEPEIIANEQFNSFTINFIDKATFIKIKHNPIICAGTIVGPRNLIIDLCKTLKDLISKAPIIFNEVNNPFNFDQALLNIIVYSNKLGHEQFVLSNNEGGIVNTIGLSHSFRKIERGFFYTKNNIRSTVVHQFDRCDKQILQNIAERGLDVSDLI